MMQDGILRKDVQLFGRKIMLQWAITFLLIALAAAILGFGGIAALSVEAARILFGVFIILFLVTAVMHVLRGKAPPL
jgi:uncharacterized membrane protein YtjA (UPF0391 family)